VLGYWLKNANQFRHRTKLKKLQEKGIEVKSLDNEPVLDPVYAPYYRAFERLSAHRLRAAEGYYQPIQISEIESLCRMIGYTDEDDKELMLYFVGILDGMWMEWVTNEITKARRKQQESGRGGGR
jgi:hypothetical protein